MQIKAILAGAMLASTAHPALARDMLVSDQAEYRAAMKKAQPGDAILWCGPGHQNYREIEGVKTAYSARAEARAALAEAGWPQQG